VGGQVPQVGDVLAGYRIERQLGKGGMGAVYLATHLRLERLDAVKVLMPELADDEFFRLRFIRESQLAASIEHPNIIPIYDADEDDGVLFIAMRYVDGVDLRQVLRSEKTLEPAETVRIVTAVAGALDAAQGAGLVHRDVKPANILIEQPGGKVFLSDFGVARRMSGGGLTATGALIGSIDYCPPEQIQGLDLDGRADVYSLGAVAFHCLSGRPPFPKESDVAVIQAHLADPVPALRASRPGCPRLSTACSRRRWPRIATGGTTLRVRSPLRLRKQRRAGPPTRCRWRSCRVPFHRSPRAAGERRRLGHVPEPPPADRDRREAGSLEEPVRGRPPRDGRPRNLDASRLLGRVGHPARDAVHGTTPELQVPCAGAPVKTTSSRSDSAAVITPSAPAP
jgi:serine/threonine-protein kinase